MSIRDLDSDSLVKRLGELLGEERNVQTDFLLHLVEFSRRKTHEKLGYKNTWTYCHKKLGLSEATTFRRTHAAVLLRKYPFVEAYLRDGRLCTTRLVKLEKALTPANAREVFDRASRATKREIEELVAEYSPKPIPKPLLRKLPQRPGPLPGAGTPTPGSSVQTSKITSEESASHENRVVDPPVVQSGYLQFGALAHTTSVGDAGDASGAPPTARDSTPATPPLPMELLQDAPAVERSVISEVVPIAFQQYLLRIGVGKEFVEDLELGLELYSHVLPAKDYAGFIAIAVHEFVEKLAKRKGAMPVRPKKNAAPETRIAPASEVAVSPGTAATPSTAVAATSGADVARMKEFCDAARKSTLRITMATKRFVWERDGGCCQWPIAGGGVCGSRRRIQFDHILAKARGGTSDPGNVRLLCAEHNAQHAREDFGTELIESKKRAASARTYDAQTSTSEEPTVREAEVPYGLSALPPVEVFASAAAI